MNKELENVLKEVKTALLNEEVVKEYFFLKEQIEQDEELLNLKKEINILQKKLCQKVKDKAKDEDLKKTYASLKEKYDNHPLIMNFSKVSQEVNDILKTIKDILESE